MIKVPITMKVTYQKHQRRVEVESKKKKLQKKIVMYVQNKKTF